MTQKDVERATGIPQTTLSGIENGSEPMGSTLRVIESWAHNLAVKLRLPRERRLDLAITERDRT